MDEEEIQEKRYISGTRDAYGVKSHLTNKQREFMSKNGLGLKRRTRKMRLK